MNNLQVKNIINKKIKLIKKNTFKNAIAIAAVGSAIGLGVSIGVDNFAPEKDIPCLAGALATSCFLIVGGHKVVPSLSDIYNLYSINKELSGGTNRFKNITERNLDKEIKKYVKTL